MEPTDTELLFARRLKELRTLCGLTQDEVAQRIGVHKSTILRWENGIGTGKIKVPIIGALAEIYGVSPIYIMGMTDDPVDFSDNGNDAAFKTYMKVLGDVALGLNADYRKKLLEMARMFEMAQGQEDQ